MTKAVNICCLKWGTKYSADYVNKLAAMVRRNLSRPHRFVCFTDDITGIHPSIECKQLLDEGMTGWWHKLSFFRPKLSDLEGTLLFLDLDVVIIASLDGFFDYPGSLCMIHDWIAPNLPFFNSSVFRLDIGAKIATYDKFIQTGPEKIMASYAGDQNWISQQNPDATPWPTEWCTSFKWHCATPRPTNPLIPEQARIIVFHGQPHPHEALIHHYKISGPAHLMPEGSVTVSPAPWIHDFWNTQGLL